MKKLILSFLFVFTLITASYSSEYVVKKPENTVEKIAWYTGSAVLIFSGFYMIEQGKGAISTSLAGSALTFTGSKGLYLTIFEF